MPFSPLSLAAVFTLSLFLSVLNYSFWLIKREDRRPLWLAVWLSFSAIFALCRLLQYASFSAGVYIVLPRALLTSAYILAWLGYELANQFIEYRPSRWEHNEIRGLIVALITTLWTTNLILTSQIIIRTIPYGGKFHGVTAGPFYLPASFLDLAIGVVPLVRLLRASRSNKKENCLMAMGYVFVILFSLLDFWSVSFNLKWVRLSDYSYLPMAVFFTYIQVQQIGKLYREMDSRIQERTAELSQTNETLLASEKQAQLSQSHLMGLVHSTMDAVISVSGEQKIIVFNPAAEKMFGYQADEILGQPLDIILPKKYRIAHMQQIKNYAKTGITARRMEGYGEVTGLKKNGREFPLEASISQVEVGGEKLFTAILRDISERKLAEVALRESEGKYRTLVEQASDGITIIQNGRVKYANPRLAEMRGESIAEIINKRFDTYLHPTEKGKILKLYKERLAGMRELTMYETVLLRKGNIAVPVELVTGLITYQGKPAEIIIVRDISERKLVEQALQRQLLEMSVLNLVATAGSEATTIDELIKRVTDAIGRMLYPDNFGVILVDENTRTWKPHFSYQGTTAERLEKTYTYSEGVVGSVVSSGKLIRLNNIHQEASYMEVTPGIKSEVAVPIFVQEKMFGCINAESRKWNAFSEHDERFMSTVADSLAIAIVKIQLFQTEKRRREDAEVLYNTTRDLVIERDLSKLLQTIVERAAGMLKAPSGGLYLCDPEKRLVRCVVSYNTLHAYVGIVLKYGEGAAGIVAETGEPLIIEDYRFWEGRASVYEEDQPFVSVLSVPMRWQDRVIGVIHLLENTQPRSFTEEDLQIARHFANQAAIAVENARLFEKEQQRRREAEILRESILSLTYSLEPDKLFEIILDTLQKLIPYDSASIELIDGKYALIAAGLNIPKDLIGTRYLYGAGEWGNLDELREPLIVSDVQNDERFVKFEGTKYIRGWLGIPLIAHDRLIGYLNLDSRTVGLFTSAHLSIAQIFGSQAAISIENMLLFQETIQNAQQVSAIAEIGRDISGTLQLDAILEKISTYAKKLLRAETSAVYLSNPSKSFLQAIVAMGSDEEQIKQYPIALGKGILGNIAVQKVGEIVNDSSKDPRAVTIEGTQDAAFEHLMAVPVLSETQLIGLIAVWRIGEEKEFKPSELSFLISLAQQVAVAIENARLLDDLQTSNLQLEKAYDTTLEGWARALELRDKETHGHSRRVTSLTLRLARMMNISESKLIHIRRGVLLHDIGKMGIPDHLLKKTGVLTEEEWMEMKKHPQYAYDLLSPIIYLRPALDIPYCHHEKWDGTGYPRGLKDKQIPLAARIFAIVDVYDALSYDRPYRKAWSQTEVLNYLREQSEKYFDPEVVNAFLNLIQKKRLGNTED